MSTEQTKTFAGHNYKADYKYKMTTGQKADGSIQLKEQRIEGDEWEPLLEVGLKQLKDWYAMYKKAHIKAVSPYEEGYEPDMKHEPV